MTKEIEQKGQVYEKNIKHGKGGPALLLGKDFVLLETLNKEIWMGLRLQNVFESLYKIR